MLGLDYLFHVPVDMWHGVCLLAMKYNIVLFFLKVMEVMAHQPRGLKLEESSP